MSTPILELRQATKLYGGVPAIDGVDFSLAEGEIHALVGENGAGKSTLTKVMAGVVSLSSGAMLIGGREVMPRTPLEARHLGIAMVFQENSLVPSMTVAQNLFLGQEKFYNRLRGIYIAAQQFLQSLNFDVTPTATVAQLGAAKKQMVEIARAVLHDAKVIIFDEPTASLTPEEKKYFFDLVRDLKKRGVSVIFISHALEEALLIADRITVLRDGRTVDGIDCRAEPIQEDRIIRSMVNRDLAHRFPERSAKIGEPVLTVENWSVYHPIHPERQVIKNVDFSVKRGEVVGIAGLMGAGRTEFAMSLFGRSWGTTISGRIRLEGHEIVLPNVAAAIDAGLAYVTEDRKQLGLILADDVRKNITLASLDQVAPNRVIDDIAELKVASDYRNRMRIRCSDVYQETGQLSGGNQQKVVLSKWLMTDPKVLILDEPTRGIDVGAKYEIYCIINELAEAGRGVVVISSEMPELLGICDRICVMNDGAFVGEFPGTEATQEKIMRAIMRNDRNYGSSVLAGAEMGGSQP
jgi:putative multiple sugar transport system ATP-binding protein